MPQSPGVVHNVLRIRVPSIWADFLAQNSLKIGPALANFLKHGWVWLKFAENG